MITLSYLLFLFRHPVCNTVHGSLGKEVIPHNQKGYREPYPNCTRGLPR